MLINTGYYRSSVVQFTILPFADQTMQLYLDVVVFV